MSNTTADVPHISDEDLRNKLQSFQAGLQGRVEDKKNTLITIGGGDLVTFAWRLRPRPAC